MADVPPFQNLDTFWVCGWIGLTSWVVYACNLLRARKGNWVINFIGACTFAPLPIVALAIAFLLEGLERPLIGFLLVTPGFLIVSYCFKSLILRARCFRQK